MSEDKRYQGCQSLKGAKGVSGQKVPRVKSSEGLLGGRVFSRTHLRSSLTPEEGPSCSLLLLQNDLNSKLSQFQAWPLVIVLIYTIPMLLTQLSLLLLKLEM